MTNLFSCQLLILWLLISFSRDILAVDFSQASTEVRFNAALNRFSTYGDVTGLVSASAGSPFSSSINSTSAA